MSIRRWAHAALATGSTLSLLAALALAAATVQAAEGVSFAESSDLGVAIEDGRGTLNVAIANAGEEVVVAWTILLTPDDDGVVGAATVEPAQSTLGTRTTAILPLVISNVSRTGKLTGLLVGTPAGGAPFTRPITISNFGLGVSIEATTIVALALLVSLLLIAARYLTLDRAKYKGPLTNPKWSFSTSWASTFTGAGALLATVVSAGALPEEPYLLSKADFAGLGIFFGALGLVAPVVFLALNNAKAPVLVFHGATWLTAAGVIGQLTTIILLLTDALGQASSSWLVVLLGAIELVGVLLIMVYVFRAIPATLQEAAAKGGAAFPTRRTPWTLL